MSVSCTSAKATSRRLSPRSNAAWHSARRGTSSTCSAIRLGPRRGVYPGRAGRRGPAAPGAGGAASHLDKHTERAVAPGRFSERSHPAGWTSGGGAVSRPAGARARPGPQGTGQRGMDPTAPGRDCSWCDPPEVEQAETHYHEALALANELGLRPLQAHCHRGLGTLYGRVGQAQQARAALSTAIALYRAMEMTFWLPQAETALAQVEAASAPQAG